jgi:hypothetical protein
MANTGTQLPAYATAEVKGAYQWTWTASTSDARALLHPNSKTARIAACWYDTTGSFDLNFDFKDGSAHQVALYMLDWDSGTRQQKVEVYDAVSGALLDSRTVTSLYGGEYLVWNLQGKVRIRLVRTAGWNAVLAGVFFGAGTAAAPAPAPSTHAAEFVKTDNATKGNWKGVYGLSGFAMVNQATMLPAFAKVDVDTPYRWTWSDPASDTRAVLKDNSASARVAACWYEANGSFNVTVELSDGNAHRVALYMLDWDSGARRQKVEVYDAISGNLIDSRAVTDLYGGEYLVWNVRGKVRFKLVRTSGWNAVLSGVFID